MLRTGNFAQVKWLVSGDIDPLDYVTQMIYGGDERGFRTVGDFRTCILSLTLYHSHFVAVLSV